MNKKIRMGFLVSMFFILLLTGKLWASVPVVTLNVDKSVGNVPLHVNFSANAYDSAGFITGYEWDLDGNNIYETSTTDSTISYTYNTAGYYYPHVKAIDNIGTTETAVVNIAAVFSGYDTAEGKINLLNFRVTDAEYSKQLDKIVMISSSPNKLNIYDPVIGINRTVNLPLPPNCASVSPDGLHSVVGYNGWISYIDLTTGILEKTIPVSTDVLDIVLAGNGFVYAFPRTDQWEDIRCVNIVTEVETLSAGYSIYAGTLAKLHPNGTAIYGADNGLSPADIEKYDITGGTAVYLYDSPYHGDYAMGGNLWISEDGLRIFAKSGNVFRSSSVNSQDMVYNGALQNLSLIEHLTNSSIPGKVVAIPGNNYSSNNADTEIRIFNYDYLTFQNKITLPLFSVNSNSYAGHGKFVFFHSDGGKYFVINQADASSGMLLDFGIVTYSLQYTPPSDTTGPITTITNPHNYDTVSGTINIQATINDSTTGGSNIIEATCQVDTGIVYTIDGLSASPVVIASKTLNTNSYANGQHVIKMKGKDAQNNWGNEAYVTVNVYNAYQNQAPVISSFTANPATGNVPLIVKFTVNASDPDGFIDNYKWDFDGNGTYDTTTSSNSLSCKYIVNGSWTVKVRVTDNSGGTKDASVTVTANKPQNNLPGNLDINSPGSANRVDGHDLYVFSKAFGSQPGDSNWNISADLDGNNIINGNDLVPLAANFGKKN